VTATARRRETEPDAHQCWFERDWRAKRGGDFHRGVGGFKLMIYLRRLGTRYQARVMHRESGEKRFSRHCRTIEEAQIAALTLLTEMYVKEGYE
jgi:hypothetical protein